MKRYRIVCDRGSIYTDGTTKSSNGVDLGVPPTGHDGNSLFFFETCRELGTAKQRLKYARKHCPRYAAQGYKRTYQYNFRIQCKEFPEWEDVK